MTLSELQNLLIKSNHQLCFHLYGMKNKFENIQIKRILKNSRAYVDTQNMYHAEEQVTIIINTNENTTTNNIMLADKLDTAKAQLRLTPNSKVMVEVQGSSTVKYALAYDNNKFILIEPNKTIEDFQQNNFKAYQSFRNKNIQFNFSSAKGI